MGMSVIRLVWSGKASLVLSDELSEALREFTTKSGKERTEWTEENVTERLNVIASVHGEKAGTALHCCIFAVYRHASDILHGTLFGSLFSLGLTGPGKAEVISHRLDTFNMLFLLLGMSVKALITVLVTSGFAETAVLMESEAVHKGLDIQAWISSA